MQFFNWILFLFFRCKIQEEMKFLYKKIVDCHLYEQRLWNVCLMIRKFNNEYSKKTKQQDKKCLFNFIADKMIHNIIKTKQKSFRRFLVENWLNQAEHLQGLKVVTFGLAFSFVNKIPNELLINFFILLLSCSFELNIRKWLIYNLLFYLTYSTHFHRQETNEIHSFNAFNCWHYEIGRKNNSSKLKIEEIESQITYKLRIKILSF